MQFGNVSNRRVGGTGELLEFAKAWIGTALAFTVLYTGGQLDNPRFVFTIFGVAALTAGLSVILHELAHRVVARYFGAQAHFIANDGMLVMSILLAFTGFLFAAPGAVWHSGWLTKRQSGLVAAAGPVTNMVLALIAVGVLLVVRDVALPDLVQTGLLMAFNINALLGVLNMLPLGPLDGAKVLNWSTAVFGVLLAVAAGIAFGLPRVLPWLPGIF